MSEPALKKQRTSQQPEQPATFKPEQTSVSSGIVQGSRVFQPYRAVGYVCGEVPAVVHNRGSAFFVTTCTGHNFQIYDCDKLGLLFVSPQTQAPISSLAADGDFTYAAAGPDILVFKRAKLVNTFAGENGNVISLLILGSHILSLNENNTLSVWNRETSELYTLIEFAPNFRATVFVHPSTYVNKVLVGSQSGSFQLWNVKTGKLVHEFQSLNQPVTCMAETPALDVVAIGLQDGTIILHNLKFDERVIRFKQDSRVTSISFRTDEHPIMATGGSSGELVLWNLEQRKLATIMKDAHAGSIVTLHYLPRQPILVSTGADNSLKEWIFDAPDGTGRILRQRSGHSAPPAYIRFYGQQGSQLLSVSSDHSLRHFSTLKDSQSSELSRGAKKSGPRIPQPIQFAASPVKQQEWDNIITCHSNSNKVLTWNFQKKVLGSHELVSPDRSNAKAVTISACGNFGIIGYASGLIQSFNLQSGIARKTFAGHTKSITGLAIDNVNRHLVSGSLDGTVKVWSFETTKVLQSIEVGSAITKVIMHVENELVAFASDDFSIGVLDLDTGKVVREFTGHTNRITDLTFSPDGRWLVSSSADCTIRVWDLPTATMIDWFRPSSVVTSLDFSSSNDYLATSHVDNLGIYLWANKLQFTTVSLTPIKEDTPTLVELSSASGFEEEETDESFFAAHPIKSETEAQTTTSSQLDESLITFSQLPRSRWQNLLNLELIKKRNKPIAPPKAPERAPFFLPTLPGLQPKFSLPEKEEDAAPKSRILHLKEFETQSEFGRLLTECHKTSNYEGVMARLMDMGPSAIDLEIRSLSLLNDLFELKAFISFLKALLSSNKNFELVQSYMNVFLQIHGSLLTDNEGTSPLLEELIQVQQQAWQKLQKNMHYTLCLVDFCRNTL